MDRIISDLPDEIIRLIVSLLALKDAASLLVTSRLFGNLYTIIPDLEFDCEAKFQGTFTDFVSEAMARLETATRIRRFSLKYERGGLDQVRINHWLRDVLNHRGVMVLEMGICGDNGYTLPFEIFTCKTLNKLKLGREIVISLLPENALLPSLETLVFDSVRFCNPVDCAFKAFISACPVLKELVIDGMCWETCEWSGIVSSQSLQRLTIGRELSGFDGPDPQYISFDTPSLTYLDYCDFVPDGYTTVNFESLVEAKLNLLVMVNRRWDWEFANDGDILSSNATNLIQGIRNVQILELSSPYTFEMLYFFREAIPVFEKLHHLTMTHDDAGFCWRFLPFLLNKAPNLKTLVIECGLHCLEPDNVEEADFAEEPDYVCQCLLGYSCLLTCPVEVLEITLWYGGTTGELQQVKHFLGKLPRLELLKVYTWRRISNSEKLRIHTHIQMFPRTSSNCRVQLSFI
ncbi:PREDICTED: F-box/LRR-repeat protein At3g58980-like [Camelina sativa]|uniref:F-box/LRR-repeat protein At3g58980-like n=1 Tax=Camelina sativa TaxID=90675 RepID=A0ABM1RTW3_CAMSA|nr:PREDICTED: F-box/LRR-repeat protein At3g58980-like [Camelina sativa]XP_019102448.1 PREDICTED: F-box/LRR-repeat protein At3g58980-like [Camelina sativa]XP_019102449.1 PREDICTED: F-box/LRR-repeat protein At3g58980-like [Camelina sativa]XP_019102450.1 PREDICTED: F-box/LRR-repeat protein At3g58980-like [Camelina sativa]XP_019102451.1 PREDICTED: F-box/LRR-repeat protein At3g58980-like [Camelina sativa]XP_019102452.1 PREDICTED: F-box/LRR-repeat protein At3g58980-like [Camelina sativa]